MCLGSFARVVETWDDGGTVVGLLDDGSRVSLSFVPEAAPGSYVLVHLGIPVEVVDGQTAREALALRATAAAPGEQTTT